MITEDYVSFETAKLLKEKGFDVYGDGSYNSGIEIYKEYSPNGKLNSCATSKPHEKAYPAPTLQMAMKWLRETFGIHCQIDCPIAASNWVYGIRDLNNDEWVTDYRNMGDNDTYEEACEAAIQYCLQNLI